MKVSRTFAAAALGGLWLLCGGAAEPAPSVQRVYALKPSEGVFA